MLFLSWNKLNFSDVICRIVSSRHFKNKCFVVSHCSIIICVISSIVCVCRACITYLHNNISTRFKYCFKCHFSRSIINLLSIVRYIQPSKISRMISSIFNYWRVVCVCDSNCTSFAWCRCVRLIKIYFYTLQRSLKDWCWWNNTSLISSRCWCSNFSSLSRNIVWNSISHASSSSS